MQSTRHIIFISLFILVAAIAGCDRASYAGGDHNSGHTSHDPGGGHGHGEDGGPDPISITLFTAKVQLFMEYPPLVKGEQAAFLAHLTVLATGEPIRSGRLTFEITPAYSTPVSLTLDAPKRDGLFVPEWKPDAAGVYKLRLSVDSPQVQETVDVGVLIVHADAHEAEHEAEHAAGAEPPDIVPFLLEQQWKLGTRYEQAAKRTLVRHLQIPGEITAPQGASAVVSPPVSGRLLPPPSSELPHIGDHVEAGQVLALVEPPLTVTTELALRSLDLEVKALEAERSSMQAKARLDFARRTHEREAKLRQTGVGTDQRYEQAEQDLRLAEAEYNSALAAESHYEGALQKIVDMRAGMQARDADRTEYGSTLSLPLRAPISGCVVTANYVEGEHVDALQEVHRIVALEKVWIVAHISEFDLAELEQTPGASMTLPAYPGKRFDILGSDGARLQSIGTVIDPESRTVPIRYEMSNPGALFRAGMLADVYLETKRATNCTAIPEEAIVLDNGRPTAYVLIDGENFQRRELELGIRDNGWVEVKRGVLEGERVVTKGAYAIKLASLSPASFGHGHGH